MEDLRYPIGPLAFDRDPSPEKRSAWIDAIAGTPKNLRAAVEGLTDEQLGTPYRPGGWTVLQLVHHVPDSHLNSYARFKHGLTEERPTIKTYDEASWAELQDSQEVAADVSLLLLETLHTRWVALLRSMEASDWARMIVHPEMGDMSLVELLQVYAWHGPHHVAHITRLRERMGWT